MNHVESPICERHPLPGLTATVEIGELVRILASVNFVGRTSMEVGVKVWVEHPQTGSMLHVASAYLVFVAIDKDGNRQKVPGLQPETANEIRRYGDALRRREHREAEAVRRKKAKAATAAQNPEPLRI